MRPAELRTELLKQSHHGQKLVLHGFGQFAIFRRKVVM
jgi:hypothetical protein